jgi:L-asparaginase / beta-aspartyl-peptidase
MMAAIAAGAEILRSGGSALDAIVATVRALEDHPLFNAGLGSLLTIDGTVEMDASVMVAERGFRARRAASSVGFRGAISSGSPIELHAGAVAAITRVRNPILLARAVMERTPHILMVGAGAERLARRAGISMCRPADLITQRARDRWRAALERRAQEEPGSTGEHGPGSFGTVGAAALDVHGTLAAATSTGGVGGKLSGRVGDSAIIGAGTFADAPGAASATGQGEPIMKMTLCREAVLAMRRGDPRLVAERVIRDLGALTGGQAGVILVDRAGKLGYAHNAEVMDIASFDPIDGFAYRWASPLKPASKSLARND